VVGEPGAAVADNDSRVLGAVTLEGRACGERDALPALDAPDLAGEARQDRRLPAEAGADLEHPVGRRQLERGDHLSDERRLCRHLSVRDRQRRVVIGVRRELGRNELSPRHRSDRLEQTLILDA
jgi:hypothetical protein